MSDKTEIPVELMYKLEKALSEAGRYQLAAELRQHRPGEDDFFGRWATHPEYGRVLVIWDKPDSQDKIPVRKKTPGSSEPVDCRFVHIEDLTFEPKELITIDDYEDAPEGTVVQSLFSAGATCWIKWDGEWKTGDDTPAHLSFEMANSVRTVLRWGHEA